MSGPRLAFAVLVVAAAGAITACPEPHPLPGDEFIGAFNFVATRVDGGCEGLQAATLGTFSFVGSVTRCATDSPTGNCVATPGRTFFTVGEQDFDAGFDGQYLHVDPHGAARQFEECGGEPTRMDEAIDVALLSSSQRAALASGGAFSCPATALDGGVPPADGTSIFLPGPTPDGFDAVVACGQVVYTVTNAAYSADAGTGTGICRQPNDAGALPGGRCTFVYSLRGDRQ